MTHLNYRMSWVGKNKNASKCTYILFVIVLVKDFTGREREEKCKKIKENLREKERNFVNLH